MLDKFVIVCFLSLYAFWRDLFNNWPFAIFTAFLALFFIIAMIFFSDPARLNYAKKKLCLTELLLFLSSVFLFEKLLEEIMKYTCLLFLMGFFKLISAILGRQAYYFQTQHTLGMITYNDEPIHYCLSIMRRLSEKSEAEKNVKLCCFVCFKLIHCSIYSVDKTWTLLFWTIMSAFSLT